MQYVLRTPRTVTVTTKLSHSRCVRVCVSVVRTCAAPCFNPNPPQQVEKADEAVRFILDSLEGQENSYHICTYVPDTDSTTERYWLYYTTLGEAAVDKDSSLLKIKATKRKSRRSIFTFRKPTLPVMPFPTAKSDVTVV